MPSAANANAISELSLLCPFSAPNIKQHRNPLALPPPSLIKTPTPLNFLNLSLFSQPTHSIFKFADLLSLHRFISQAGIPTNIVTYNLLFSTYMDFRRTDTTMEYYKYLINDAPFKGLVDNQKLERAMELKDEMLSKGLDPDPIVYSYLKLSYVTNSNPDGVFNLFEELKEKLGGSVSDGVIYGGLMKGHFLRWMEKEAMECYEEAVGENSKIKMSAMAFNYVLDALSKNAKFDEALNLFGRMLKEHDPPKMMMDAYYADGRFKDAINVFMSMGEKRCRPDTLSYNNLIEQLCKNGMLMDAEELKKLRPVQRPLLLL